MIVTQNQLYYNQERRIFYSIGDALSSAAKSFCLDKAKVLLINYNSFQGNSHETQRDEVNPVVLEMLTMEMEPYTVWHTCYLIQVNRRRLKNHLCKTKQNHLS
ncbi:hypothetical protein AMECASPLE_011543 [Ameca splendens]|uniref:Uncharacterized protein n=1 Tax=Ameca splendens TaxID=208324 RepID=A0ABV0ZL09_9TELE